MHKENWDDLRYVLAVAEAGSVNAAAQKLQVNHATILRRVAAFEARHQTRIFERSPVGYLLRPGVTAFLEAARKAEAQMLAVERALSGTEAALSGPLRLTSTDTFAQVILPPILTRFKAQHPDIIVEMKALNTHLDLARLEADLTVRPVSVLPEDLDGLPAGEMAFSLFAPLAVGDPEALPWLSVTPSLERSDPGRWLRRHAPSEGVAAKADSFLTLAHMVAAGLGKSLLPDCMARALPGLLRLSGQPVLRVPTWVACHPDFSATPKIARLRSYLADALRAVQD